MKSEVRSPKSEAQGHKPGARLPATPHSALRTPRSGLAFVALGSNLGDSTRTVRQAMARLQAFSDRPLLKSSLWRSSPVDCPPGSPDFVNAVAGLVARKDETPEGLLAKLRTLERASPSVL